SSYVSYGPTLQALSGYTTMMADSNGEPAGYGYSYADMCGGDTGALAGPFALLEPRRTRRRPNFGFSQFEAVTSVIGASLMDISVNHRVQEPFGYTSQEGPAAPHGVYRCRAREQDNDRWVAISVRSQPEWERLVRALGKPVWANDPKFRTLYLRMHSREDLDSNLAQWTMERSAEEVMMTLQAAQVAAGLVANGADLCKRDPQLKARGFWPTVQSVGDKTTHVTGIPFRISSGSGSIRSAGPEVGENGEYVLGEILGFSRAEREELLEAGVVWP